MTDQIIIRRWHIGVFLLAIQAMPFHVVFRVWRYAPKFLQVTEDFGGNIPENAQFFFATWRFWIIVPIATTLFAALCFHPKIKTATWPVICFVVTLVCGYAMKEIFYESSMGTIQHLVGSLVG